MLVKWKQFLSRFDGEMVAQYCALLGRVGIVAQRAIFCSFLSTFHETVSLHYRGMYLLKSYIMAYSHRITLMDLMDKHVYLYSEKIVCIT